MNKMSKIEAFKSFYEQANTLYNGNKLSEARELFIKAASLANEISMESSSYNARMEYHSIAEKILTFLKCNFNKSKVTAVTQEHVKENVFEPLELKEKITFNDVAGLDDVKEEIKYNVIEPLKNPSFAKKYDIQPGAKILLYGPPGTGKTYIAKAIAGEIEATFYSINCQDLISKYMGESSKQIDMLFKQALMHKRAIIFFDEFDSVASKRDNDSSSVNSEMSRFVATLLTKVDGFEKPNNCEMLLLIAATNRPWAIDSAMLRGGRFDTQIYVGVPNKETRMFLIKKEFANIKLSNYQEEYLCKKLSGFGGADIVAVCKKIKQSAYRRAIKTGKFEAVDSNDVSTALNSLRPSICDYDIKRFEDFKKGVI